MYEPYANPTLNAAIRMEMREKKCGCCTRSVEVIRGAFICKVNKQFPRCKGEVKGFDYDDGGE